MACLKHTAFILKDTVFILTPTNQFRIPHSYVEDNCCDIVGRVAANRSYISADSAHIEVDIDHFATHISGIWRLKTQVVQGASDIWVV